MRILARRILPLTAFGLAWACHAESLPLWEAGAGIAALSAPDYRGSDERTTYYLPLPYVVYRGEFLKADRNGVRASMFAGERFELNLSANATLPVNSRDNAARRGMENLRPAVEIGPTADFSLWQSADRRAKLDFRMPVRAAFTIESSPRHIGWLAAPALNLVVHDPAGMQGWRLGMLAGPLYGSRRYNGYFYSVGAQQATVDRPAYSAAGGYAGTQFTLTLSKRFRRFWVGAFVRQDSLAGAVFDDSPLVRRRSAISAGFGISAIFGASSTSVEAAE